MSVAAWKVFGCTCWLILLGAPACGAASFARHQVTDLSGIYRGRAAQKDPARRVYTLTLVADGTAIFTTLYIGKDDATQRGRWMQTGNQIVLTFDAMGTNQPPRPITFQHRNHELNPIRWDASEWGRSGPPVLRLAGL